MEETDETPRQERQKRISVPGRGYDDVALTTGRFAMHEATSIPSNMQFLYLEEEDRKIAWEMNYNEAAIYLQEGETYSMFSTHPKSQESLPIYLLVHNRVYRVLNLLTALILLLLALFEYPTYPFLQLPVPASATIEMLCLLIILIEMVFRLKWMGHRAFFSHAMSVAKTLVALALFIDVMVLWAMMVPHFRILRALRPLFLYDSYYCNSVKAFCKYLMRSVPPVLEMIVLILYIIVVYAVLGFYLYVDIPYYTVFFADFPTSFYSLFEFFTTVNYPDVMMPAYNQNRANAIFFISMICITLYFMMNLVTATVYGTFADQQKQDVKKHLLHRREAVRRAFNLLVTRNEPHDLSLRHFYGMMKNFMPRASRKHVYLIFKALNKSKTGRLSIDEFYNFYDISKLKFTHAKPDAPWYMLCCESPSVVRVLGVVDRVLNSLAYNIFDYLVLTFNYVWIVYLTVLLSVKQVSDINEYPPAQPVAIALLSYYTLDIICKFFTMGPHKWVRSFWCMFDLLTAVVGWATQIANLVSRDFTCLLILRPIRLLKLLGYRKRYKDLSDTLVIMVGALGCLTVVMITYLYFWSIVGGELFAGYNLTYCCQNSFAGYQYVPGGFYYDNNFDNIIYGMVTLFELLVINNWLIHMEAYAVAVTQWSRIFFIVFYFSTMVVITTVVAFFLEAFKMHMAFTKTMGDEPSREAKTIELVYLSPEERCMCENIRMILTGYYIRNESSAIEREIERMTAYKPGLSRKRKRTATNSSQSALNDTGTNDRSNRTKSPRDTADANTNASRMTEAQLPDRELFVGEAFYSNLQVWLKIYSSEVTNWLEEEGVILKTRRRSYL